VVDLEAVNLEAVNLEAVDCKGTYARVRPHRYTYGNYRNTVANVDASDSRCRCVKGRLSLEI